MEKTAYSAEIEAEWLEKLQWLIDDEPARKAIAGRHMAGAAASVSQSFMPPGFASGWSATGIYAVPLCFQRWRSAEASALHFLHAEMLVKAGAQVSLFTLEGEAEWYHEGDFHFPVLSAEREKLQGTLDLAVATMWNTAEFVEQSSKIRKKKYLVQNFEVGFIRREARTGSQLRRLTG